MHSIGSAHAEVRSRRRETALASTTDRILLIIGWAGLKSDGVHIMAGFGLPSM